ncbi:type IV secretory system conjugative DNA transfer family protein [Streptomyces griseiscabiei]|uniref:Type IV secretory system conjugative DNA transfer family protein n=1 Tax=Streptomyces griseiscabiei TaxID=2993540 RepID=A0ABU4LKX9_9ACTN|nr:type IV secretory system conjugative DNA transfer family protein [Streptomyces griseiscabiei]MBZ3908814.1 ATP-binding protein [Streptomyces griseiscabiei]MDX2916090.1 type IV secretory system conjugative DNA transfer family protein [Streptomyces griseiscabiei]
MAGTFSDGVRHLRAEWGRWWRAEDLTDTHVAHKILNDQYRMWRAMRQRANAEVQSNIKLLKDQQRQQTYMQMQRMQMMRRGGGRGGGGYYGGGYGASPIISYRMMQWAQLQMRIGQEEFKHLEVTDSMLQIGYGQVARTRHRAAFAWFLALPLLWALLWWISITVGLAVTAATIAVFLIVAFAQGRNPTRRRPPVPKLLFVPSTAPAHTELEDDDPEPFPIREAGNNPRQAREAVRLALKKEAAKVKVSEVLIPEETVYGWKVPLVIESGEVVSVLKQLAKTLRVGESRVMAQPADPNDAALVTLQILTRDPFADPPPYPERAPLSCSIRNQVSLGISLEGETTPVVLAGQHVIIVADTGGGKTAMVQAIAEYVTACHDAVIVDVDPVKRGLKAIAPAAVMTARTPQEAEDVLEALLERAKTRIASMPPTQDSWQPTPDGPAIIAVLDEFPKLSKRGKALAVDLLRTGREALISIVLVTQDATSDVLSDAIADAFNIRIMLPCRAADVPIVVGRADAVSRGWLPHLLVPSPEPGFPADAGRFYAMTPRHREPILRYVTPLPSAEADRRTRDRIAAGLPRLETAAGTATATAALPETVRLLFDIFATHSDPEALTVAQLADGLVAADPAVWGRWEGRDDRLAMIGRTLKSRLKKEKLDIPTVRLDGPGRPTAYRLADIKGALS